MNRDLTLVCAACSDRIGVYERFWRQNADGTVTSPRDADLHAPGTRVLHDACVAHASESAA